MVAVGLCEDDPQVRSVVVEALAAVDRAVIEGAVAYERLSDAARALVLDPRAQEQPEARCVLRPWLSNVLRSPARRGS